MVTNVIEQEKTSKSSKLTYVIKNPTRVFGRLFSKSATLSRILYKGYCLFPKLLYSFFCLFPIQTRKVVVCNFGVFGGYGDNPKYLVEELLQNNFDNIVWLVGDKHINDANFPPKIKRVKYGSIKSFYELATAEVWIDNQRKNSTVWKRKGQFYLQTWHGGYLLKKMSDGEDSLINPAQLDMIRHDCEMTDLVLSNSQTFTEAYRSGYHYSGEIYEVGFPRNDIFFKSECELCPLKEKVLSSLSPSLTNTGKNLKILIYAPTYRSTFRPEVYNLDIPACLDALKERFGGDWICLVRLHPIVSVMSESLKLLNVEKVYDVSNYPDAQELLAVSDIMITDYSSIIFDFTLTRKLGILLTPDLATYKKPQEYGLAVDVDTLPFLHANTNDELLGLLKTYNHDEYVTQLNNFFNESGGFDNGDASRKCVNRIITHCSRLSKLDI